MPSRPPNIIWILTTQWRASATGYSGDANARTPALDRLASQSVDYRQATTPHPFGPFARAALLTGIESPENGVNDYYDPLPVSAATIAHTLERRGYQTGHFGKWHLSRRDPHAPLVGEAHARMVVPPENRGGFQYWEGFEGGFLLNDPWLHGSEFAEPCQFPGYQSDVVSACVAGWIRRQNGPWFAVASLEAPHPPYAAPAAGVEAASPADLILPSNVPQGGQIESRARRELAGYYAHITATDRAIGRLLEEIDRTGTIVVFTSVHGDMHGAHGLFRKGWPYEESVRVPLLVRHPGQAPRRDDSLVSLRDLPAMALAWSRGGAWQTKREAVSISMPSVVRLPDQCDRIWCGWRSAEQKVIWQGGGIPWLLFDLSSDPGEERNRAADPKHAAAWTRWRPPIAASAGT